MNSRCDDAGKPVRLVAGKDLTDMLERSSSIRLFLTLLVLIFCIEMALMFGLQHMFPEDSPFWMHAFVDAGALTGISSLFIWRIFIRPLKFAYTGEVARLAAIVESSTDAIIGRALDGKIASWNAGAERLFGYTAAEALGRNVSMLIPPDRRHEFPRDNVMLERGEAVAPYETERVTKDGRRVAISQSISPIKDSAGTITGAATILRDISERKQAEERIDYLAQYDTLTGLPNRRLFHDRLTLAIARAKRMGSMTALLLLDLDRFKQVNETLSHSVGDGVLQAVTARLKENLRDVA